MKRLDEFVVHLKQWLAPREHDETALPIRPGPAVCNRFGQAGSRRKTSPARSVHANEIRIAEGADGPGSIDLSAGPEIAPGEPAKHGRASGVPAFSLQGIEDLFDGVGHLRQAASAWAEPRFNSPTRYSDN